MKNELAISFISMFYKSQKAMAYVDSQETGEVLVQAPLKDSTNFGEYLTAYGRV